MALDVDVAVIGAGGAGLSLLTQLDRLVRGPAAIAGVADAPSIALVDPVHRSGADRTWCFWDHGESAVEAAVHRAWSQVELRGIDGVARRLDLAPLRYVMVRSQEFYALADDAAAALGAVRVLAPADEVVDGDECALVRAGDELVRARWVLDARPATPLRPPNTAWLQHFRGWTVRFGLDAVDPSTPVLMDFTVPQPERGVAFGYVLPSDERTALVEYTEFSRRRLAGDAYDDALHHYLAGRWGEAGLRVEVLAREDGAIPMTDAVLSRRAGRRVFRIGTAGGATRGSTGYTFAAMQRQAAVMAVALLDGREPLPPAPYPARHRWMDAVLLRALDRGHVRGAELFTRLFDRQPAERVLRFLDGETRAWEDAAIMRAAPMVGMTRAAAGDVLARSRRRRPGPGPDPGPGPGTGTGPGPGPAAPS